MDRVLSFLTEPLGLALVGVAILVIVGLWVMARRLNASSANSSSSSMRELKQRKAAAAIERAKLAIKKNKLDEAFDALTKCPADDEWVMHQLEGLALKFEKQGKLDKAERVHSFLASQSTTFQQFQKRMPSEHTVLQMDSPAVQQRMKDKPAADAGGAGDEPEAAKPKGKVQYLGPYRLQKVLAKSAAGIVYKAVDEKTNQEAAIKAFPVVQNASSEDRHQAVLNFANEARSLSQINHPNIARVLRVGKAEGVPFFATELIAGVPLSQHSAEGALLDRAAITSIAVRVADALQQAHERGLVHGDVRPGNIFYDADSQQVKVTDFGVAQIATSIPTAGGVIHGTPSYMSPEQISGRKVDARSDLYSLCVTIYQLLTGKLPHGGDSFNDLLYAIVSGAAPDIRALDPELPTDATGFFQKGLAKNPNQRYQSGHELADALRKALAWA